MAHKGINKVILIGNLGQDPDIRYMPNGNAVTNIKLATSESWRDKQTGETKEQTEWHRIVLFGKLAEIANEYLHKGSQIYIEGQLRTRKWTDQSGQDKYTTEIVVSTNGTMQMLGNRQTSNQQQNWANAPYHSQSKNQFKEDNMQTDLQQKTTSLQSREQITDFDDEIPF